MGTKAIKYTVTGLLLLLLAYNSVYFKRLDEVRRTAAKRFDAPSYAQNFYRNGLLSRTDSAVELSGLVSLLKTSPANAFRRYARALDVGNIRYFLVQGAGTVVSVNEDDVSISLSKDSAKSKVRIATEFVYGNAIRDASGLVNLGDFSSTADFNAVSEETNKIVRKEVVPAFKARVKPGSRIAFSGAIELNQAQVNLDSIEVMPIQLTVLK